MFAFSDEWVVVTVVVENVEIVVAVEFAVNER